MLTQITPDVVTSNVLVNAAISYFSSNTANAIVNGSTIIPYTLAANTIANNVISTAQLANNLSISGNTNFNNVPSSTTPTNIGVVQVGPILNFTDVNIQMGLAQSVNNYSQIILQNSNTGTQASADFIVNNDSPAGTTIYGDFGINSTIFNGSGAFSDANGTYAYASGGTMSVGTYGANNLKFATNNTTQMTLDTNGNLGLGVTPSTSWTTTTTKTIQIGTTAFVASIINNDIEIGSNCYWNGSNWKYLTNNYATAYTQDTSAGIHFWRVASSGTSGNTVSFTQAMTLLNSGYLGIGTTSPAGILDINQNTSSQTLARLWNTNTSGTGSTALRIVNSGNNAQGAQIQLADNAYYNATISADRSNGLQFYVGQQSSPTSTLAMTIAPNASYNTGGTFVQIPVYSSFGTKRYTFYPGGGSSSYAATFQLPSSFGIWEVNVYAARNVSGGYGTYYSVFHIGGLDGYPYGNWTGGAVQISSFNQNQTGSGPGFVSMTGSNSGNWTITLNNYPLNVVIVARQMVDGIGY